MRCALFTFLAVFLFASISAQAYEYPFKDP
jgi:hypothetical protein